MGRIFVSSDLHFGHDREFLWGPRGFRSSIEHDEAIIANWNSVVGKEDIVYVFGKHFQIVLNFFLLVQLLKIVLFVCMVVYLLI